MTRIYYKDAVGGIVVFDVTDFKSFQHVDNWVADIREKLRPDPNIPLILMANKADIMGPKEKAEISDEQIEEMAKKHGFKTWKYTSAKENEGIDDGIGLLIDNVMEYVKKRDGEEEREKTIKLDESRKSQQQHQESTCCGGGSRT
eukprot:TRINITY_DN802_c0_g1_i6.p1 TRINITY_DN802_c0_g1~~TRINITY_DN802_c0_g1_i6.p1  ORF type:complete len:145 (+),score=54.62 TRINITY_DN802_c0_g1_i6:292-726(+)